ncbi:unnamed protein product, partial [Oppiella nova]
MPLLNEKTVSDILLAQHQHQQLQNQIPDQSDLDATHSMLTKPTGAVDVEKNGSKFAMEMPKSLA